MRRPSAGRSLDLLLDVAERGGNRRAGRDRFFGSDVDLHPLAEEERESLVPNERSAEEELSHDLTESEQEEGEQDEIDHGNCYEREFAGAFPQSPAVEKECDRRNERN